ncbi:hypothetical protein CYY_008867 [Polysphondylium violaceum]|uniref:DUF4209 domain-containing protein n=1 Tax=Polysphondylium violaceum TaxID=133409 RepID=A0A8J4PNQ3_9MYCE|nr:hypothetical protein CYY_008867 [Polysphondylium violaceum]
MHIETLPSYLSTNVYDLLISSDKKIFNVDDKCAELLLLSDDNLTFKSSFHNIFHLKEKDESLDFYITSINDDQIEQQQSFSKLLEFFNVNSKYIRYISENNLKVILNYSDTQLNQYIDLWFSNEYLKSKSDNDIPLIPHYPLFIQCLESIKSHLFRLKDHSSDNNNNHNNNNNDILDLNYLYSIIFSIIERMIGDIIYCEMILDGKTPIITRMLRDLLDDKYLHNVLDIDIILLLKLIIGPPIGLNFRNIIWHGFISPYQLKIDMLLLSVHLIFTISKRYQLYLQSNSKKTITPRSLLNYEKKFNSLGQLELKFNNQSITGDILKLSSPTKIDDLINNIIDSSSFIIKGRNQQWKNAFKRYFNSLQQIDNNSNDRFISLVTLLPQLEHSLRVKFVESNQLSNQFLNADYTSYYTTLDLFLAPTLWLNNSDDTNVKHLQIPTLNKSYSKYENPKYSKFKSEESSPSKSPQNQELEIIEFENKLVKDIGYGCMGILLDLLMYMDGPRLRDRIAHGEIDHKSIPLVFSDLLMILSLDLCIKYSTKNSQQNETIQSISSFTDQYTPMFHTKSIIISKYQQMNQSINNFTQFYNQLNCSHVKSNENENEENQEDLISDYIGDKKYNPIDIKSDILDKIVEYYNTLQSKDININNNNINLFPEKLELDIFKVLGKSIQIVLETTNVFLEMGKNLYDKIFNLPTNVGKNKTQKNSLYKWIGVCESMILLLNITNIQIQYYIYDSNTHCLESIKLIEKIQFYFEKLLNKTKLFEWDNLIKLVYQYYSLVLLKNTK